MCVSCQHGQQEEEAHKNRPAQVSDTRISGISAGGGGMSTQHDWRITTSARHEKIAKMYVYIMTTTNSTRSLAVKTHMTRRLGARVAALRLHPGQNLHNARSYPCIQHLQQRKRNALITTDTQSWLCAFLHTSFLRVLSSNLFS